ncbi:uncharacterized protein CcaverHIS019_0702440 [Cutaneotrichosporon cavernicola]|uniref:Anaphase-promoting complex subunit 4 n=1 Tax=Cutaneotrichosporon cavernicola TaxID=279322 RepID=A0AA48LA55_9TREE|nr:uncharacterized protein CcaverHIS019_0702440 [Cutaneotrichosporon cavernicola]BEI94663.1 hypothetical protein CcaverHIS019_0702440 [Cutaneotrichosporon cavernicola]BEJ02438.1 hypothetical protein CcaverHIS631_0702330 [Cutaneotrichosporon cavernicola]BEJ10197.1 hypothetical protein CcaverHIS641_0702320 [Cutaneotrichosporon cavernicola]
MSGIVTPNAAAGSSDPTPTQNGSAALDDDARSFSVASTSSLKYPHLLHPRAANPAMDLAALVREPDEDQPGVSTLVSLWRLSGAIVWEVRVTGRVLGLAWSPDGLFLSLIVLRLPSWPPRAEVSAAKSTIEQLSVHTGDVVKAVQVPAALLEQLTDTDWVPTAERDSRFAWWPMEWVGGEQEWPSHKSGAPLMIIDSLPGIERVEPPKPAIINPFAPPPLAAAQKGLHEKLESAPTLLPSTPQPPPSVLVVSAPVQRSSASARLLTGTMLLPPGTPSNVPPAVLEVAMRADTITRLLDPVFRGIESCAAAYRDAERQTVVWRESLESCGQQHNVSTRDVHADLYRFLMCRRSSPGITEWLGNRLTNRPVAKWDTTVQEGYITVMTVLTQSVIPALERVLLVLEEMNGWALGHHADQAASILCRFEFEVVLDRSEVKRALALVRGLFELCEDMRQAAALEWETSVEWFKWLRYEMARAVSNDEAGLPVHDTKLVWSYMVNGFSNSRFRKHFPHVIGASNAVLTDLPPALQPAVQSLDEVMKSTLTRLHQQLKPSPLPHESETAPAPVPDHSASNEELDLEPNGVDVESNESFDTVGENGHPDPAPTPTEKREPLREPWAWANALLATTSAITASARVRNPEPILQGNDFALPTVDERIIGDELWALVISDKTLHVLVRSESLLHARFSGEVVNAAFYGDDEVAVVLARGSKRWFALVSAESLRDAMVPTQTGDMISLASAPAHDLMLSRVRTLGVMRHDAAWGLALNPAEGRRSGWVLTSGGDELCVLDLEANEDEEWDEEEEGEGAMEE